MGVVAAAMFSTVPAVSMKIMSREPGVLRIQKVWISAVSKMNSMPPM